MVDFDTIKYRIKNSSFYYWVVLVIWQSILEIPRSPFIKDKIRDMLLTLTSWLIISVAIMYGFVNSQWARNLGAPVDFEPYIVIVVLGLIFGRFLQNLLTIPARLYFDAKRKQDRLLWDHIIVTIKELKAGNKISGYGINVKNEKSFPINKAIVQIPYLEVDNVSYKEESNLAPNGKGRRLSWVWNDHMINSTEQSLAENGGSATAYLYHKENSLISYYDFSQDENKFIEKTISVKNSIRGKLSVFIYFDDMYRTAHEYVFEFEIDGNRKPTTKKISNKISNFYERPETKSLA